ncbi:Phosphopantetheinyl transferase [Novosphingobium sp. CF614]|uniref:4'-phosphopantetheinyl transferase family protein n=1 Tax=Novosphingobium sp. CF614 TaxID=1884364 RepID=UPI0008DF60B2|nr:4'-phosphopantetheinyl transferase superfamily protein [Novosphingobium sp. CF614]SFG29096.1 Phosphopantetheinyl transferase [Novosphingobium sp. CF614]
MPSIMELKPRQSVLLLMLSGEQWERIAAGRGLTTLAFTGAALDHVAWPTGGGAVFLFALDEWEAVHDAVTDCLSDEELAKADAKRFAEDRMRRRLSFGLTRHALSRLLGCLPTEVNIVRSGKGKPFVPEAPFHYNVSHSRAALAVAVGPHPLGVDIEPLESLEDSLALAELFLREPDIERVRQLSGDGRDQLVRRLWTECEAYLKAKGRGIDDDMLRTIRIPVTSSLTTMRDEGDLAEDAICHVHYLGVRMGHHLSFALSGQRSSPAWPLEAVRSSTAAACSEIVSHGVV